MVYAIIFSRWPDQIKIGYTSRNLKARYGGARQFKESWTWGGDKNHETALRCLMGLRPSHGFDWFPLTEDRYSIINRLDQDYLNALAARVVTLRVCDHCGHRYHKENLFDKDCPVCGQKCWRSPLMGQAPRTGEEVLRRALNLEKYCYPRVEKQLSQSPTWKPPIAIGQDYCGESRVSAFRTSDMIAFLRQRRSP